MNILIDDLPDTVLGTPVNTDFRAMVQLEQLIQDPQVPPADKIRLGLQLFYTEGLPTDPQKDGWSVTLPVAWDGLLWFYRGGEGQEPAEQEEPEKPQQRQRQARQRARRVYDFEQDADRIYAAFRQVYGVDLQGEPLHWWAFRAMLFALPDSCLQGKIMGYRATDTSKLKGAEKKRIQRLQQIYAIKTGTPEDTMSTAERERQMRASVLNRYQEAQKWRAEQMTGSK